MGKKDGGLINAKATMVNFFGLKIKHLLKKHHLKHPVPVGPVNWAVLFLNISENLRSSPCFLQTETFTSTVNFSHSYLLRQTGLLFI